MKKLTQTIAPNIHTVKAGPVLLALLLAVLVALVGCTAQSSKTPETSLTETGDAGAATVQVAPTPVILEHAAEATALPEQSPLPSGQPETEEDITSAPSQDTDISPETTQTEILMLNVGKGDAILIKTQGKAYLIDAGKVTNAGAIMTALKEEGITYLDGVFLTHTDSDHTGALSVLSDGGVGVGNWYAPRYYASPKKEEKHPAVIAAALMGQEVTWLSAGDTVDGLFEILAPAEQMEDEDDNSLVMMLTAEGRRVLLTGDMESMEEEALLFSGADIRCDVLKIPNHGDDDAASESFLLATEATVALISTSAEEKPGTPSAHITYTLASMGAAVYCTEDAAKGIRVTVSQSGISVEYCAWQTPDSGLSSVVIAGADAQNDTVILQNTGTEYVDISRCALISERGEDLFLFPEGTVLEPGTTLTVGSRSTDGYTDILWNAKNVLHNKKEDAVILYDAFGRETDRMITEP